jgi:hypothetical protein
MSFGRLGALGKGFGRMGAPLGRAGTSAGIQLSNSSFTAGSAQGTAIGTLSVTGGTGTYTFTLTDSATNKAQVAGTNGVNLQAGSASASAGAFNITVHADNGAGSTFDRTFSIAATAAPANTVAPSISGSAIQGATLTATSGTWTGYPVPTLTYQWKRAGVAISGATGTTYAVQNADVGSAITVTVTGTNGIGSPANATSSATATVTKTTLSYTPVTTATQNSAYTGATPSTSGGTAPYTYSIASGTLPTGLSVNSSTGVISGTPTAIQTATGLALSVTDANGVTDTSSTFQIDVTSVPAFTGSGDVKSGAYAYWSPAYAYNAAYAAALGNMMDVVDQAGANQLTVKATSSGLVDLAAINTWKAANSVTTIKVKKLYDQTGNGRDVSQATLANMPTLLLSHPSLGSAAIPVLDFVLASSQALVSAATGLSTSTGTFSTISRQSHYQSGSFGGIIQAAANGVAHTFNGGITMFAGSTPNTAAYDETFLASQCVFNGASSFACVNGVVGAAATPGGGTLGSPFTIGKLNNSFPMWGQIGEIRFDNTVWSSADCTADYTNQFARWFNRAAHEGFVASRCRDRATADVTNGFVMARSAHIASEALTSVKTIFNNEASSGTTTITQSIEYPAGTFTQILFNGSATGTIRTQNQIVSDYATVSVPSGATFWVRTFWQNTGNASYYNTWQNTFLGEATQLSTTSISDLTMSGTVTNSGAFSMPPAAIIGVTTNKSVVLVGDSICAGTADVEDTSNSATGRNGVVGYLARSVNAQGIPFINTGRSASQANFTVGKIARAFGSALICEYGVNDFFTGAITSAALITRLHGILDLRRPGQKAYQTTITPETTSTDSWATTGNQTLVNGTQDTQRQTFNTAIRGSTTGLTTLTGFIDAAGTFESGSTGKWIVSPTPPYTVDGVHPNQAGHTLAVSAGIVPTL